MLRRPSTSRHTRVISSFDAVTTCTPRPRRHENTILLDKLSKILTREKTAQAGGAKLPTVAAPSTAGGGLHDIYRRRVREQIDRENQSLLRRLQYMKPSIDMVHFEPSNGKAQRLEEERNAQIM